MLCIHITIMDFRCDENVISIFITSALQTALYILGFGHGKPPSACQSSEEVILPMYSVPLSATPWVLTKLKAGAQEMGGQLL